MSEIAALASAIFKKAGHKPRFVVAIAGPPGSGKSTLAERLVALFPDDSAAVVPMDGFHFDDRVLIAQGIRNRKGAPETFDYHGFEALIRRIRANETDIAIPVFDRSVELSRAGAAVIAQSTRFVIVEGNYLLLDEDPWKRLDGLFDLSIYLDVPKDELERRLRGRWDEHGKTPEEARAWIAGNDMPNIERVIARRRPADMVIATF